MGEIDDKYQENVETLDNQFFEGFKQGKNKEQIINHYRTNLEKHRTSFEQQYQKALEQERKNANKKTKKKEKKEAYKVLEVKHFDFNFSSWQRFKYSTSIKWFRFSRAYHKGINKILPSWLMYLYYKITITWKAFYRELKRLLGRIIDSTKKFLIKTGKNIAKGSKKLWQLFLKSLKWLLATVMFWKKKKPEEKSQGDDPKGPKEGETPGEEKAETETDTQEEKKEDESPNPETPTQETTPKES